jgi:hypothetical protein
MTKQTTWFSKFDKIQYGILAGVLSSFLGFLLNYFLNPFLFNRFLFFITEKKEFYLALIGDMMTLALLVPMVIFYFTFFRGDYQQFSRGLLLVILPIVIFIVYLQL